MVVLTGRSTGLSLREHARTFPQLMEPLNLYHWQEIEGKIIDRGLVDLKNKDAQIVREKLYSAMNMAEILKQIIAYPPDKKQRALAYQYAGLMAEIVELPKHVIDSYITALIKDRDDKNQKDQHSR